MGLVIGIDLGGTKTAGGVLDDAGRVLVERSRATDAASAESVLAGIADLVRELAAKAPGAIEGVGVGAPGTLDHTRGVVVQTANLPFRDTPMQAILERELGMPVVIENDANAAALAEHRHGAAAGASHSLMLTIGTGVGGGVVIGDRLLRGARGAAGELGHMVVDVNGPPCPGSCPNHGCLESLASGTALRRDAIAAGQGDDVRALVQRALDGETEPRRLVLVAGEALAAAVTSLAVAFDPEVIVLGGGVMESAGPILLPLVREAVRTRCLEPQASTVRVEPARFGNEAGIIGAAEVARAPC